jgi:hypothetical protein
MADDRWPTTSDPEKGLVAGPDARIGLDAYDSAPFDVPLRYLQDRAVI